MTAARDRGIIVITAGKGDIVRLVPPLIVRSVLVARAFDGIRVCALYCSQLASVRWCAAAAALIVRLVLVKRAFHGAGIISCCCLQPCWPAVSSCGPAPPSALGGAGVQEIGMLPAEYSPHAHPPTPSLSRSEEEIEKCCQVLGEVAKEVLA